MSADPLSTMRRAFARLGLDPDKMIANLRDPEWVAQFNKRRQPRISVAKHPGAFLRAFREEQGISRKALADELEIRVVDVKGLEGGSRVTTDAGWAEIQTALFLVASRKLRGAP